MEACRDLCLTAPYRCHSFDYGDTGDRVCRLSHHTSTTLTQIQVWLINLFKKLGVEVTAEKQTILVLDCEERLGIGPNKNKKETNIGQNASPQKKRGEMLP